MKSAIYLVVMLAAALTVGLTFRGILGNVADDVPESLVLADDTAVPPPIEQPAEHPNRSPDGTIHYLFQEPPTGAAKGNVVTQSVPKTPGPPQPPHIFSSRVTWAVEPPTFASGWSELKQIRGSRNREERLRLERGQAEILATEQAVASILGECDRETRVCSLTLTEDCTAEEAVRKTAAEREGVKEDQAQQYDVKYAIVWDPVKKAFVSDNWEKLQMPTFEFHGWYYSTFGVLR